MNSSTPRRFVNGNLMLWSVILCSTTALMAVFFPAMRHAKAQQDQIPSARETRATVLNEITSRVSEEPWRTPAQQRVDSQILARIGMRQGESTAPGVDQLQTDAAAVLAGRDVTRLAVDAINPSASPLAQTDIVGPVGSGAFGTKVTVLPNGNIVVTDPLYDEGAADVGAVYLYNGANLLLISVLKGTTANDQVGNLGITVLSNGNYVVRSSLWDNSPAAKTDVGAATFCNATTGCAGTVSAGNSLVGSSTGDTIGSSALTTLPNGNYLVSSPSWDNPSPAITNVGAVTLCNGTTGCTGAVSAANSLVGSTIGDQVGNDPLLFLNVLTNGNYVVGSPSWDNPSPAKANVGAVTFCNGTAGCVGTINAGNSLIGSTAGDQVGNDLDLGVTVIALDNGNYVVVSPLWDQPSPATVDVGAATWCNGTTGCVGTITGANSLIGSTAGDQVGTFGNVWALANGNYVVGSYLWDNPSPATANVGAVTLCNGATGCIGTINASNSLIGSTAGDQVGFNFITALTNGNYVVGSPSWDNPSPLKVDVGAATFCNGTTGCTGTVTSTNSLTGSTAFDQIGLSSVIPLTNGNYVVDSPGWDNPSPAIPNVGAVTFCTGTTGCMGAVSAANSLVGSTASDQVGNFGVVGGVTSLTNGNYVVGSFFWDNPSPLTTDVGAVTFCNGTGGCTGAVSVTNSLIGSTTGDQVSSAGFIALASGNYVVRSQNWDNPSPAKADVGAVTFCNGTTGCTGAVGASNSLIGSTAGDNVGTGGVRRVTNGHYVVQSNNWDNPSGPIANARAVTFGDGNTGTVGTITAANSVLGTVTNGISTFAGFSYDAGRRRLFVGRSASNIVTVVAPTPVPRSKKTGVFRPATGELFLKNANSSGFADTYIIFGNPGDYPVAGDWNADGIDSVGIYRNGVFYLRNSNSTGFADIVVPFGNPGDQPVVGDWNGDGVDTIGVYRNGTFLLRNSNTPGPPDLVFTLGNPGDVGIAGDWDGDGVTTCGVFRPSNGIVFLKNSNTTGFADLFFVFGNAGDKPVAGDWNADGIDTVGIYRNGLFFLTNSNTTGFADTVFALGNGGDFPIAGNWNGSP